jgi:hypothetical protein
MTHNRWTVDDPRRVLATGDGIAELYSLCWGELTSSLDQDASASEATDMLSDLYRYIAVYLGKQVSHEHRQLKIARPLDLPLGLLDRIHLGVMRAWPATVPDRYRVAAVNAYESYRNQLLSGS